MKSLIKIIAAAAVAVGVSAGVASAQTVKFGVAAEPYPPFSSQDASGKWVGWEMDLMDAVCAQAQLQCELVPTAWDGIIPALTSKKIDVIWSSMSITEERMKTIDFTDMYYDFGRRADQRPRTATPTSPPTTSPARPSACRCRPSTRSTCKSISGRSRR